MKTSELTGAALDWAVATASGDYPEWDSECGVFRACNGADISYSTDWALGGPIIEHEVIVLTHPKHDCWTASAQDSTDLDMPLYKEDGSTPMIAAMRCYVASKLGDEVEIPNELGETK